MIEFMQEAVSTVNLPFTVLVVLATLYWGMTIIGGFGFDAIEIDLDVDGDVDFDLDADTGGFFGEVLGFMYLGEVPLMVLLSLISYFLWLFNFMANHYLNPTGVIPIALALLLPNFLLSCLMTKAIIWPFLNVFQTDQSHVDNRENMLGVKGVVKTSEVSETFGQIEIQIDGPPVVVNARTRPGEILKHGDLAKIDSYNPLNDTYLVSLSKWEKK